MRTLSRDLRVLPRSTLRPHDFANRPLFQDLRKVADLRTLTLFSFLSIRLFGSNERVSFLLVRLLELDLVHLLALVEVLEHEFVRRLLVEHSLLRRR